MQENYLERHSVDRTFMTSLRMGTKIILQEMTTETLMATSNLQKFSPVYRFLYYFYFIVLLELFTNSLSFNNKLYCYTNTLGNVFRDHVTPSGV